MRRDTRRTRGHHRDMVSSCRRSRGLAAFALAAGACMHAPAPAPEVSAAIPFDFSRHVIALDVTLRGRPLHVFLDTGVDPSLVDLAVADELHLPVDRKAGGEASGGGGDAHALAYPATIEGLAIQGRAFHAIDAIAMDMSQLSSSYGRRLDGVLGHSFLVDKTLWVDYEAHTIQILERADEAASLARSCRQRWSPARVVCR